MTPRSPAGHAGLVASACFASSLLAAADLRAPEARADDPKPVAPLTMKLKGLRSNDGKVGCALYDGPRGFPVDATAAIQQRWCAIQALASTCAFDPIPRGTYAVACFHDENNNSKFDRNFLGIPTEGSVASNHAKARFGPPKYEDAKFTFPGTPTELVLTMSY
jgi:uncharacterized protein (DUF2141 family)